VVSNTLRNLFLFFNNHYSIYAVSKAVVLMSKETSTQSSCEDMFVVSEYIIGS